jgi:hypothetical protein
MLGSERMILGKDGAFRFAVMPGRYHLKICCSNYFQSIDREVLVEKNDVGLDLTVKPLIEIKGRLEIQRSAQVPSGFLVTAALEGTNVVDRATTEADGTFTFHLLAGNWEIRVENLPAEYRIASITQGENKVRGRRFTVAEGATSLPLQITVQ